MLDTNELVAEITREVLGRQMDIDVERAAEYVAWSLNNRLSTVVELSALRRNPKNRRGVYSVYTGCVESSYDRESIARSIEIEVKIEPESGEYRIKETITIGHTDPVNHTPYLDSLVDEAMTSIMREITRLRND